MINKSGTTELLKKLVAIRSPYFEEDAIIDFAYKWLKQNGLCAEVHQYHEKKATGFKGKNVVLELDGGAPGPVICLNGHLDSVKLCKGWTKSPDGEQDGDKLFGLGALDMKSGCASLMVAVANFSEKYRTFHGKIKLTLVSVEEGPFGIGTNALIEDGYLDDVDFSIITEPSAGFSGNDFPVLCLGARGGYGLTIDFYGKSAHAASPKKGISALVDAAKVVNELEAIEFAEDPFLGKGNCCVVSMHSDGGACSVPDYASVKLFWHIVNGETPETIVEEIKEAVSRANIKSEYKINFREAPSEASKGFMPYTVDKNNPMVTTFIHSIEDICGKTPTISYFNSIGDFCYLGTRINAPAIIFGAAGENYHGKDEYVLLDSVYETAEVIFDFLEKTMVI